MTNIFSTLRQYIKDPHYRFDLNTTFGLHNGMSDEKFIRKRFKLAMGYNLDLENPITYSEKLQWLKLYNRRPEYTVFVDKVLAKNYVAKLIGKQHVIPTLGVWTAPEQISFGELPPQFVLKCNHNSGTGMCICKDKASLNIEYVKSELRRGLNENYYISNREWPYKNVPRKILAEQYMEDKETGDLRDYKFFCFDGEVKALYIATDRQTRGAETKFDFYDAEFNHLPLTNAHPNALNAPCKPKTFEKMKEISSILSKGIPHVRIDLYEINGEVYFGEYTFFHMGGMVPFVPPKWDKMFGEWINLPERTF